METVIYLRQVAQEIRRCLMADIAKGDCPGGSKGPAFMAVIAACTLIDNHADEKERVMTLLLMENKKP